MINFKNKVALITGASSGIGLSIAKALSAEGASVAITGTNEQKLNAAAELLRASGARVMTLKFDVADEAAWHDAAARVEKDFGPIQFLALNAGIALLGPTMEATLSERWNLSWSINVMGIVHGLQACLPGMRAHGQEGHVLITSSMGGVVPVRGMGPYGVTKAAAVMLAEILHDELSDSVISNSIMVPAAVRTDLPNNVNKRVPGAWSPEALAVIMPTLDEGLDPDDVAQFTLERIRAGDFYIMTHNLGEEYLRKRYDTMNKARSLGSIDGTRIYRSPEAN